METDKEIKMKINEKTVLNCLEDLNMQNIQELDRNLYILLKT